MYELIPILGGAATGVGAALLASKAARAALIALVAVTLGFAAAGLSGEIEESWAFVLWDAAQAAVAAALALWVALRAGLRRRPPVDT